MTSLISRRISQILFLALLGASGIAYAGNNFAIIEQVDMAKNEISVFDIAGNIKVYSFDKGTVFTSGEDQAISAGRLIPSETVTLKADKQNKLTRVSVDTHYINHHDVLRERRLSAATKNDVLVTSN